MNQKTFKIIAQIIINETNYDRKAALRKVALRENIQVSVKEPIIGYYSEYAGNPKIVMKPGETGTIGALCVPNVRGQGYFHCVDFHCSETGRIERCGVETDQLVFL